MKDCLRHSVYRDRRTPECWNLRGCDAREGYVVERLQGRVTAYSTHPWRYQRRVRRSW